MLLMIETFTIYNSYNYKTFYNFKNNLINIKKCNDKIFNMFLNPDQM